MEIHNDSIIFLGLNKSATFEVQALRNKGNNVYFIKKGVAPDKVAHKKTLYNLSKPSDVASFVATFKLHETKRLKLISAISNANSDIKDEIAGLAIKLFEMEGDKKGPTRFVVSGHHVTGGNIWGDENGTLDIKTLKKVTDVFPVASSLIEDIHLAACNTGFQKDLMNWKTIFPSASTIWGYTGSAPGTYSGAVAHLTRWDKGTRGTRADLKRSIADKSRKGLNVAVWSSQHGYQEIKRSDLPSQADFDSVVATVITHEQGFQNYLKGVNVVFDPQTDWLRNHYDDVQYIVGHTLATPAQVRRYSIRLNQTIRILYYIPAIRVKFSQHYNGLLTAGYKSVSRPKPNYATLSRADALKAITDLDKVLKASPTAKGREALDVLVRGLKNLESSVIPDNWI